MEDLQRLLSERFGAWEEIEGDTPFQQQMLTRRSIRRYQEKAVPEAVLRGVLAAGLSAPTKSDLQQVSIIRLGLEKQHALAALVPQFPWVAQAPVCLVFCGDGRRIRRLAEQRSHPFANEHLDSFMNAAVDAGIVLVSTLYAAEAAGLGGCPVSEIRNRIDAVSELLELPQHVFPLAGLCLGWPAEEPVLRRRLPPQVTLHQDCYDDSNLLPAVDDYDQARATAEPTRPDRQRHRDRWGEAAVYGWSEDRTRQYAEPARDDWGAYIRKQGFDLS